MNGDTDYAQRARASAESFFSNQRRVNQALADLDLDQVVFRLIQDCIAAALPAQWERRAQVLDAARPRATDWTGSAPRAELEDLDARNARLAAQCRLHAALLRGDDVLDDRFAGDLQLVKGGQHD